MQQSAIPDYLFCINSVFVAIEFKVQRDKMISISPLQIRELNKIKDASGVSLLIAYDENQHKILIRNKRLSKIKSKHAKIDWDFEFSAYSDVMDLLNIIINDQEEEEW
jgi:Holliday junction resolvase